MKKPLFLTVHISFIETIESWLAGIGLGITILGILGTLLFFRQTKDTFYHGIYIDDVAVGGMTKAQALSELEKIQATTNTTITLAVDDIAISSSSAELGISKDFSHSVSEAFEVGRAGFPLSRLATILKLSFQPKHFVTNFSANNQLLQNMVAQLAPRVDILGEEPSATLELSGVPSTLVIEKGAFGRQVDQTHTTQNAVALINQQTLPTDLFLPATVASTAGELSETEITAAKTRAEKFIGKKAIFTADDLNLTLNDQDLISLLRFSNNQTTDASEIIAKWEGRVNREPQEPVFEYDPQTLTVKTFTPPRNGLALDEEKTTTQLTTTLAEIENAQPNQDGSIKEVFEYALSVEQTPPKKSLASTNNLGINERIGFGDSEYDHSIPSRIHNVALTSSKITNHIVAPGQEFSFNQALGEVSGRTGFKPAYVIRGGRTELGDGGGVCQVSTTLFRSVLDAGLKITKRKQHSYRVSYYELNQKPGIDATVYSGDVDFRFINDTGHHILISSNANSDDLYMTVELYGTSDGRQTEIINHEVWDYRSPPSPVYTVDPSLPHGAVRQVDWAVSGVKTQFTHVIKDKDGAVIRQDDYYSNYVPWSAKYIVGP